MALRIGSIGDRQPVAVSLCSTHTALISCALSLRRCSSIFAASAPVRQSPGMNSGFKPSLLRHVLPLRRELAGLDHQHAVARRQRIDQRRFPGAGAGRGVDDDRIGGLENGLDAVEAALGELGEFGTAVVDDRRIHRAEHAVGQRRRPWDLQEVTPGGARSILRHYRHSIGRFDLPRRRMSESARGLWR